jgi:streptomycin 6-kinase
VINVPWRVQSKARALGAEQWLQDLPVLVAALEAEWDLTVGRPYEDGTDAFVAEATLGDGTRAVLKLANATLGEATAHEITALHLAHGEGCALLLRADPGRRALLLERLGRPLSQCDRSLKERQEILCRCAERFWRPAPGCGLPTGAQKAQWLEDFIGQAWEDLDRPCAERTVDQAIGCAERRRAAHEDDLSVLVHGDVHQWNALQADAEFKLVDPDGLLAEAEYDMGILMREDSEDLLDGGSWDRAHWLATRTRLSAVAVWEWGLVERVSTGLLGTKAGLQPASRTMLAVADLLASSPDH